MAEIEIDKTKTAVKIISDDKSVELVYWFKTEDGTLLINQGEGQKVLFPVSNWKSLDEVMQSFKAFLEWQKVKNNSDETQL